MNQEADSSLELLLDTITNTFGGILFLALLVVVLLQMTSEATSVEAPNPEVIDALNELEVQLIAVTRQRDELVRATRAQDALLRQLATESNRRDLERLRESRGCG